MTRELKNLSLALIDEPINQHRTAIDSKGISELMESMKALGLMQPIIVRKNGGTYEIIAGHRRYLAAQALNWPYIDAFVEEEIDEDLVNLERAHENLIRENLSVVEEGKLIYKLVYEDGRGVEATAKMLCKSEGWVSKRMDILRYPQEILSQLEAGKINLAVADIIRRVKPEETRKLILDAAIEHGATARVVEKWIDDMSTQNYLAHTAEVSEQGEIQAMENGEALMQCRICSTPHKFSILRHIWLCPDCLMGIRDLAREVRAEMEKNAQQEQ